MSKRSLLRRIDQNVPQASGGLVRTGGPRSTAAPPAPPDRETLGEWRIGAKTIAGRDVLLHSDGWIQLGSGGADLARLDAVHATHRLWIGDLDPLAAPFRVDKEGHLTATGATIAGTITAVAGLIGGWTIHANRLESDAGGSEAILSSAGFLRLGVGNDIVQLSSVDPAGNRIWAGHASPGDAPFRVKQDGSLEASKGLIAGWEIHDDWLIGVGVGGSTYLYKDGSIALGGHVVGDLLYLSATDPDYRIWAGHPDGASAAFKVRKDGSVFATAGEVAGWELGPTTFRKLALGVGVELDASVPRIRVGEMAAEHVLIDGAAGSVGSSGYSPGVSGWQVGQEGDAEFNDIRARGVIRTPVFLKDEVTAIGGSFLISESDVVAEEFTTSASIGGSFFFFTEHDYWAVGDFVRCKPSPSREFWAEIFLVEFFPANGSWRYSAYLRSGDTLETYPKGTAIVGYGPSGQGLLELTSSAPNSPHIRVFTHAGSPWSTTTERVRLGRLDGITDPDFGALSGYGLWTDSGYFGGSINAVSGVLQDLSVSGLLDMQAGGELRIGTGTPGVNFSGLRLYRTADPLYRLEGQDNGQVQILLDSDGKLYSGNVASSNYIRMDRQGLWILSTGSGAHNAKWRNLDYAGAFSNYVGFANTNPDDPNGSGHPSMDFGIWLNSSNQTSLQTFLNGFQIAIQHGGTWAFPLQADKDEVFAERRLRIGQHIRMSDNPIYLRGGTDVNHFIQRVSSDYTRFGSWVGWEFWSTQDTHQSAYLTRAGNLYIRGLAGIGKVPSAGNSIDAAANLRYDGNLVSRKASTDHTVYGLRPLIIFSRHSSLWNSSYASAQDFSVDLTDFKRDGTTISDVPAGATAVAVQLIFRSATVGRSARLGPNATYHYAIDAQTQVSNVFIAVTGLVPVDGGSIRFVTTGAVENVYVRIWGYYI
jgi:hypothetical protein